MLGEFFADVVDAPVVAIQVEHGRSVALGVQTSLCHQALHHRIAKHGEIAIHKVTAMTDWSAEFMDGRARIRQPGALVVIARIAQHDRLEGIHRPVREEGVTDLSIAIFAAGKQRHRLLWIASRSPSSKDFDSDVHS